MDKRGIEVVSNKGMEVVDMSKPKLYSFVYNGVPGYATIEDNKIISIDTPALIDLKGDPVDELHELVTNLHQVHRRDPFLNNGIRERAITQDAFRLLINHLRKIDPTLVIIEETNEYAIENAFPKAEHIPSSNDGELISSDHLKEITELEKDCESWQDSAIIWEAKFNVLQYQCTEKDVFIEKLKQDIYDQYEEEHKLKLEIEQLKSRVKELINQS